MTFVVTHGTGGLDGYEVRVTDIAREEGGPEAIAVSGHTHQLTDTTVAGTRLLDPGSTTGAAPANRATMLTVDVAEGAVDVTHHER